MMRNFKADGFSFELGRRSYIMGILNITDDSFYDGGRYNSVDAAVKRALLIQNEGADIIDIGANSTRPGSTLLSADDEIKRFKEILPEVVKNVNIPISVDTFYPEVAEYTVKNGAKIINDVSGKINIKMLEIARENNCGIIFTHNPCFSASEVFDYSPYGVTEAVKTFFNKARATAENYGVKKEQLMLDIGIGFSKSHKDNIELIKNLSALKSECALLCALSMKRVTSLGTGAEGEERLYPTLAADTLAISGGADFLRVHHVREAVLAAKMADEILR